MDTEEGVEVVWNEVIYSQSHRKGAQKDSKVYILVMNCIEMRIGHYLGST